MTETEQSRLYWANRRRAEREEGTWDDLRQAQDAADDIGGIVIESEDVE